MNKIKKSNYILPGLIIGLGLILRLINLNQSFWLDEAAQVLESIRPFSKQFDIVSDFNPPLYHLMLYFWIKISSSETWTRLFSVILSIGSLGVIYLIGKKIWGRTEGLLALFFVAISPYHIWYSQEARPYMLFLFLSVLVYYLFLRKNWILMVFATVLLIYSNYFAVFFLSGILVYAVIFNNKDRFSLLKVYAISFLFFLPWFPSFIDQLHLGTAGFFGGWIHIVSVNPVKTIPLTFAKYIFGRGSIDNNLIYALVIAPVFLLFLYSFYKLIYFRKAYMLLLSFFVPFFLSVSTSFFIPVVAPQRLLYLLPFFYLILAGGLAKLRKEILVMAVIIITIVSFSGIIQYYTDENVQREKWREAIKFIENDGNDRSVALSIFPDSFAPVIYYNNGKVDFIGIAPSFMIKESDFFRLDNQLKKKDKVYLFQYLSELTDPDHLVHKFLIKAGYKEKEIKNFSGVGFVYVYEKT